MSRKARIFTLFLVLFLIVGAFAFAADQPTTDAQAQQQPAKRTPLEVGLIALSAALAVGLTALGTGIAQSRIGAAGAGTIAERPESMGTVIILLAIPETLVILGFIVAVIILFTL
jgi:V/A-type H+-transporting ATPase subunit K